ncbi:uncharacterized protein [Nicotiana tomentosiformis]|uniref:uncharacterized protein n=1 Tax=Nicotiana tomentosiformis TaxID=4098 RepID=UPI00051AD835|nr:uncharacterized protein LOC104088756 [Nicotiana tomentosiformis]
MGGDKTEKVIMVLKIDFQCSCYYKKVEKVLCKFPQIRDEVYDEKANTVTITVVCCDPERFRDKLCSKGCGVIKSIEIKDPPKPKDPEKPTVVIIIKTEVKTEPTMVQQYPPRGYCCGQCSEGHIGGPCYEWYGRPVPCYDNYGPGPYVYGRCDH